MIDEELMKANHGASIGIGKAEIITNNNLPVYFVQNIAIKASLL